jgi:hypothetical protein
LGDDLPGYPELVSAATPREPWDRDTPAAIILNFAAGRTKIPGKSHKTNFPRVVRFVFPEM